MPYNSNVDYKCNICHSVALIFKKNELERYISFKNRPRLRLLCLLQFYLVNLQLAKLQAKAWEEIWQYPSTVAAIEVEYQWINLEDQQKTGKIPKRPLWHPDKGYDGQVKQKAYYTTKRGVEWITVYMHNVINLLPIDTHCNDFLLNEINSLLNRTSIHIFF